MSSPVTGSDFGSSALTGSICDKLTALLSFGEKIKLLVEYLFDSSGDPTQDFKGIIVPPPGVVWPFWSSSSDDAAIKAQVEGLYRTAADIADTTKKPYFRLCDGSTYGSFVTPNLKGRVVVCAGTGTVLTARTAHALVGAEEVTLTTQELPPLQNHFHGTGRRAGGDPIDAANNDFEFIMREWTKTGTHHYNSLQGQESLSGNGDFTDEGNAATTNQIIVDADEDLSAASGVPVMQPGLVMWYIVRTNERTS